MGNFLKSIKNLFQKKTEDDKKESIRIDERGAHHASNSNLTEAKMLALTKLDELISSCMFLKEKYNIYYDNRVGKPDWMDADEYAEQIQILSYRQYMTKICIVEEDFLCRIEVEKYDSPQKKGLFFYDLVLTNLTELIDESGLDQDYYSQEQILTNVDVLYSIEDEVMRDILLEIYEDKLWESKVHITWSDDEETKEAVEQFGERLNKDSVVDWIKNKLSDKSFKIGKQGEIVKIDDIGVNEFISNITMDKMVCLGMFEIVLQSCHFVHEEKNAYFQGQKSKPENMSNKEYEDLQKIVSYKHYFEKSEINDKKFLTRIVVRNYDSSKKKGLYFSNFILTDLTGIDFQNRKTLDRVQDDKTREICLELLESGNDFLND
jgi:hypothetical protein